MALGDGTTWDESNPTDNTLATQIDDYNRDIRKGIRSRLALEHEFPGSQSATSEAGRHKYITLQQQATSPSAITGTQVAGIYVGTDDVVRVTSALKTDMPLPRIVQIVNTQTGAVATGSTVMPWDDTIPQLTEGTEFMTLAITPTNTNNKLKIEVVFNFAGNSTALNATVALFQDSTAGALAAASGGVAVANESQQITFTHFMTAGTITSTTFRVRAGGATNILTFNGVTGGRKLGGVMASSITITEVGV